MIVAAFIAAIRQNVDAMQLVLIVAILIRLDMPKEGSHDR